MQPLAEPDLAEKVAFLRRPGAFPDAPAAVEAIETHFAWVFLSRRFAYKLKKPVRLPYLDLSTLQTRRANCELEISLNRRLAADTYIGVVALGRHGGELRLESQDDPVDWLVKMRRLPRKDTLEQLLPCIELDDSRLDVVIDKLAGFYARTARAPWNADEYAATLLHHSRLSAERLMLPELESDHARVQAISAAQRAFIDRQAALLAQRIAEGRVCDAHGDLRPEHVFLLPVPQIIDCLEFSAELRQLDAAEEIAFLALECERRERADIADRLRTLYCRVCADDVPSKLFAFYRSRRALVRAFLSAWHLKETADVATYARWIDQARWYISAAESSIKDA